MSDRIRQTIERGYEWVEAAGFSVEGVPFSLIWWKKVGLRWTVPLVFVLGFGAPLSAYARLAYVASHVLPNWVGGFGVRFEAKDWDIHPLALSIVARDVTVRSDERSAPVLTAAEVDFDGSLATVFGGWFRHGASYNSITIRHGELHVEQSLNGVWNWEDFLSAVPEDRRAEAIAGLYELRSLNLDDLRVVYTEHVPGSSGGGVIQTVQATVYIEGIKGSIVDLVHVESTDRLPTRFQLTGRSADGIVEMRGTANLFASRTNGSLASNHRLSVSTSSPVAGGSIHLESPYFEMRMYLENIGLAAYSQMVPTTRIMMTKGSLRGTIDLTRHADGFVCRTNLAADNVELAPNPRLVPVKAQYDQLVHDTAGFRSSGPFNPCEPVDVPAGTSPTPNTTTVSALLASLNVQATQQAPPSVQAFAALDRQQLAGVTVTPEMAALVNNVAAKLGLPVAQVLHTPAAQMVNATLGGSATTSTAGQPTAQKSGNVVTSGLKSVGSGIKHLFGGGEKKPADTKNSTPSDPKKTGRGGGG